MKKHPANNLYSKHYQDEEMIKNIRKRLSILLNSLPEYIFENSERVLDVGCGTGDLGYLIRQKYDCEVFGIDLNKYAVKQARKIKVKARLSDLEKRWPYQKDYFDLVISVQVVEHLLNPDHFLKESKRVLKPNGLLVISTPNLAAWFNRIVFLAGFQPFFLEASTVDKTVGLSFTRSMTPAREPLGHIKVFTLAAIKDLFWLHGLKIKEVLGGSAGYLPNFMKPLDYFFSFFPSLATDLIIIGERP